MITSKQRSGVCMPFCSATTQKSYLPGAMWLKVIRKADCYLMKECLGKYRRRANSITPKPVWQRIWAHYPLFRVAEEMNPISATFWVIMNVFGNAWKKYKYVKKYNVA